MCNLIMRILGGGKERLYLIGEASRELQANTGLNLLDEEVRGFCKFDMVKLWDEYVLVAGKGTTP